MAQLVTLFDEFLRNINPDEKAVEYAKEAHTRVRENLETEDRFKEYVEDSFLYGSYKRRTAVGDIKDVDIVLLTNFDPNDPENTPAKVLRKLKAALARCYEDPENPEYQRRSIRVNDPLPDKKDAELTLDVIPAVVVTGKDNPLKVPDREQKEWIFSHPKGHLRHTSDLNADDCSDGWFVPLVKAMKWWWKYQCEVRQPDEERPKPKGFWVECLTGEKFDPSKRSLAEHFIAVLENISNAYSNPKSVPELYDPGLEGEKIKTNMTLKEFSVFMDAVTESLEIARNAYKETDELKSSELWREIFGDKFPLYEKEEIQEASKALTKPGLGDYSHAQKPPWPVNLDKRFRVRLDAYLYRGTKFLSGINSDGRVIGSDLKIKFLAKVRGYGNYEVHWQVVNTGKHAELEGGLRGGFFQARGFDGNPSPHDRFINWEPTKYTGKHWIECFIVKEGVCVARSKKFYVNVKNPGF